MSDNQKVVAGRVGDHGVDLCKGLIRELETISQNAEEHDLDVKRICEALGLSEVSTLEEILEACRALKRSVP